MKTKLSGTTPAFGHTLAIITILIWGITFISTKILLVTFSPVEVMLLRLIVAYTALLAAKPRLLKTISIKHELMLAAAGLTGVTLYFMLENVALTYSQAANVSIMVSVAPFLTGIAAFIFLGEKLSPKFFAGFIIAIAGIVLISFNGRIELKIHPAGDIMAVSAAFMWAAYSVLIKKLSACGYNTILLTRRVFFYGMVFMIPFALYNGVSITMQQIFIPKNLINIVFLGLGASAMCFATWNIAVRILGAARTSVYIYAVPVLTVITSVIVLNETIPPLSALGILLTLSGLVLSEFKMKKHSKETATVNTDE